MPATVIEIVIVFILMIVNGVLAMSEIAIISARKGRLKEWSNTGDRAAKLALDIANAPSDFLSTVQVGITLVGIFAGAFAGSTIAEELAAHLKKVPALVDSADALAMGIVVSVITYFSLIVGELVPKRLALSAPERIARLVARPMQVLSLAAKPVVILLSASTGMALRLLGVRGNVEASVTEAEIHIMLEQATEAGVVEETEQEMLVSVLKLGDRKVASIMTPRPDIVWIDVNASEEQLWELVDTSRHARFLVADESLDNVLGVVESKSIMRRKMRGQCIQLRELVTQPDYVPENTTALKVLESFRDTKQHLALVMNEYGGLEGLVSRDDIFEAIVGELPTYGQTRKWEACQREDGSWLLDGQMPFEEFKEIFEMDNMPGQDESDFHTLAGFIIFHLERVPSAGEHFDWQDLRFEIVDMDRHRIDKVLVTRLSN